MLPSPPCEPPTMSLLNQAWIGVLSSFAFFACAPAPTSPCSSPATVMKTSVASNSMPLSAKTRASSIDSTVPLPSSLAPGATMLGSRAGRCWLGAGGSPGACGSAPGRVCAL
jgi:hypothetical protein